MPVRLVCPSCSATLSVKDEYAGRAVKCPKCGGVIPASQPGAAAPTPSKPAMPPVPPPPPAFEEMDEPAPPKGGKITGRPSARPAAKAGTDDMPEDADAPKSPKRKGRDEDDRGDDRGPKSAKKRGDDEGDGDDDRPRKKKRGDDDGGEDDGDGPRGKKKKGGSKTLIILLVVFGGLFTCCGGGAFGVWYYVIKPVQEKVENFADNLQEKNDKVTSANFQKLKPLMTQSEVEAVLGKGQPADAFTLLFVLDNNVPAQKARLDDWDPKANTGRVVVWRNKGDVLVVAFHDKPDAGGKLQMKMFIPKAGALEHSGEVDDAKFAKDNNLQMAGGPPVEVSAEDLGKAYKDDKAAADEKYKDKNLIVEGKLEAIDVQFNGDISVRLIGVGAGVGGLQVRCPIPAADKNKVFNCSRGQTIKVRGKCAGQVAIFIDLLGGKFESAGPDTSTTVTAGALITAYAGNEATADDKYKDKQLTITNATVESKTAEALFLVGISKAPKSTLKIKVSIAGDFRKLYDNVKVGDKIKLKGECGGAFDGTIFLNSAWLAP